MRMQGPCIFLWLLMNALFIGISLGFDLPWYDCHLFSWNSHRFTFLVMMVGIPFVIALSFVGEYIGSRQNEDN